ncbi:hypothetical protein Tco_1079112 [Tanacetum coccineum]|uniref:Uncharacterized protein n=1 Tax=Tanacetum coccineum TaxID=301880 RepID=A0ABQ5HSJ4_9ASTR
MDSEKEAQNPGKRLKRIAGLYAIQKSPKKPKVKKSAKDVIEEEAADYEKEKEELRLRISVAGKDGSKRHVCCLHKLTRACGEVHAIMETPQLLKMD